MKGNANMTRLITPSELESLSTEELRLLLDQAWEDIALYESIERALYCRLLYWPRG